MKWIVLIAFALRTALVLAQHEYSFLSAPFYGGDSLSYETLQGSALRTPGYPLFLSGIYALFGRDFLIVGLIQSAIGALSCLFVYGIGKAVYSEKVGLISAVVFAVFPSIVLSTSGYILTEGLFIFLTLGALYVLITERNALLAGFLLGAASLTRPVMLYFSVIALLFTKRKYALTAFSIFALMIGAWAVRNYYVVGYPVLTTTGGGWVLWEYHNPQTEASNGGFNPAWTMDGTFPGPQVPEYDTEGMSEVERDRFYSAKAKDFALNNPGREVTLTLNRFWNVWRPAPTTARTKTQMIYYLTYVPMILLALLGLTQLRNGLLWAYLGYHFLFYLFLVGEMRFRFPLEPVLIIIGVGWLCAKPKDSE